MIITIFKVAFFWIVLILIGTNLTGMVVRGLVQPIPFGEHNKFLDNEINRIKKANLFLTSFFIVLVPIYLYLLFRYFGIGVSITAIILIIARVPDLLCEIKSVSESGIKIKQPTVLIILTYIMIWGTLPILWYSLR